MASFKLSSALGATSPSAQELAASAPGAFERHFGAELVKQSRRIVEDALRRITDRRAYFSETDLIRGALQIAEMEVPVEILEQSSFTTMIESIVRERDLVEVGATGYLSTPEMMEMEEKMLRLAGEQTRVHMLTPSIVRNAIARKDGISEEQVLAVEAACLTPNRVTVIEGSAGSGKSYTMEAVKESYQAHGYDVMGMAISWSAAKVLGASAGLDNCRALEGVAQELILARQTGTEFFRGPTLVIVDEAGMVSTGHMSLLLEETARSKYPIKIVLTGDSLQVNPIQAGNALEAIIEFYGTTRINTIRRQKQATHRESVMRFSERQAGLGLYPLVQQEAVHFCPRQQDVFNAVARDYLSFRLAHPGREALVLAQTNKEVSELNRRIRGAYRKMGLIGSKEIEVDVTDGNSSWKARFSVGDEVVIRSNDKDLRVYQIDPDASTVDESSWNLQSIGVFNRNAGRVVGLRRATKPAGSWDLIVDMGGDCPGRVVLNTHKFKHPKKRGMPVAHNYATTIYASQGQTVDQVFLCDSPNMQCRLAYVGMSRHRWDVQVYLNEEELHLRKDRSMGKAHSLKARKISDATGRPIEDLPIEIGRYSRSEMLQTVAMTWSKQDDNMAAAVFEKRKRTIIPPKVDEKRALLRPLNVQQSAVDFLPEQFERIPRVDIVKILDLPDPIVESVLVPADSMDKNRLSAPAQNVPLHQRYASQSAEKVSQDLGTLPPPPGAGILEKSLGWMLGKKRPAPAPTPGRASLEVRQVVPETLPLAVTSPNLDNDRSWLERVISKLARRPTVPVPFLPMPEMQGAPVLETVVVEEDGVQKEVLRVKGFEFPGLAEPLRDPSAELIEKTKGFCWEIGRGGEPRILARNPEGVVVARYRFDGTCVVGEGQAPIWANPAAAADTPVYLVQEVKEWFRLHELATGRYAGAPEKVPHLVWCGKDVDLSLLAPHMRGRPLSIAWRRDVPGQQEWAEQMQAHLLTKWGLEVSAVPAFPKPVQEVASGSAAPLEAVAVPAVVPVEAEAPEAPSVPVEPVVVAPGKFRRR